MLRLATAIPGLSSIGYGVLAALAHMAGQFALAYWVLLPHPGLLRLLPVVDDGGPGLRVLGRYNRPRHGWGNGRA
jgi:hypothetical protein